MWHCKTDKSYETSSIWWLYFYLSNSWSCLLDLQFYCEESHTDTQTVLSPQLYHSWKAEFLKQRVTCYHSYHSMMMEGQVFPCPSGASLLLSGMLSLLSLPLWVLILLCWSNLSILNWTILTQCIQFYISTKCCSPQSGYFDNSRLILMQPLLNKIRPLQNCLI